MSDRELQVKYAADESDVLRAQDRMSESADDNASRTKRATDRVGSGWRTSTKAILGVGLAITGIGLSLHALAAPLERAEARLHTTVSNTGHDFDALAPRIAKAQDRLAKLGFTSVEVDDALSIMTLKLKDPKKALALLADAADVARSKQITLAAAADLVAKLQLGNAKAYGMFGIKIQKTIDPQKALTKATKEHADALKDLDEARRRLAEISSGAELQNSAAQQRDVESATRQHARAVDALASAQQRLRDTSAVVNADDKITISEKIRLRNANVAVAKAQALVATAAAEVARAQSTGARSSVSQQQRLASAQQRVKDAQDRVKASAGDVGKAQKVGAENATKATKQFGGVHKLVHGAADAQSKTSEGRIRAWRAEITNALADAGKRFGGLLAAIGPATGALDSIRGVAGPVIGALKGIQLATLASVGIWILAAAAVAAIVYVVVRNWGTIHTFLKKVWGAIAGAAKAVFGFLKDRVRDWMAGVGVIVGVWQRIWGFLRGVWRGMLNVGKAVFGAIKWAFLNMTPYGLVIKHWKSIQAGIGAVVGWLKKLPGRIVGFFSHLGSDMLGAGRSILEGLLEGIKSGGRFILSKIPGILRRFIPKPIKDFFGISSPSKMAMGWGAAIAQGMAVGMEQQTGRVEAASRRLAGAVRAGAAPRASNVISLASRRPSVVASRGPIATIPRAAASTATGSAALGGTVVNVHVHVAGSVRTDREITEAIRGGLAKIGIRNAGALRSTA